MLEKLSDIDIDDMRRKVEALPEQIEEAGRSSADLRLSEGFRTRSFTNIALCGMGGSAISGDVVKSFLVNELSLPMTVIRNYHLPAWVGERTLLFSVSYSGNTEETLSCLREGMERGAGAFCISSDGEVLEMCEEKGLERQRIPGGWPPRSALGYLMLPIVKVLNSLELCQITTEMTVEKTVPLLERIRDEYLTETKSENVLGGIARSLTKRLLMIYAPPEMEAVARRWMTQLNENSKVLAHWGTVPEMNHNELVGWSGEDLGNEYHVIFLTHKNIYERVGERIRITKQLMEQRGLKVDLLPIPGEDMQGAIIAGIYTGDILSLYLAGARKIDPTPVEVIDHLKSELAKMD